MLREPVLVRCRSLEVPALVTISLMIERDGRVSARDEAAQYP